MLKSYFDLLQTYKSLGDIFSAIGVREPQARASEAFTKFGQYHRLLERDGIKMLKTLKPVSFAIAVSEIINLLYDKFIY